MIVRQSYDLTPAVNLATVMPDRCHKPVAGQGCCLAAHHSGPHLAYPRWPRRDVSQTNPRFVPTPRKEQS